MLAWLGLLRAKAPEWGQRYSLGTLKEFTELTELTVSLTSLKVSRGAILMLSIRMAPLAMFWMPGWKNLAPVRKEDDEDDQGC